MGSANYCPIQSTLSAIGGKWKFNILYLLLEDTVRFSEIKKSIGDVSQKILTEKLRELEADGLVNRKIYPVVPPKVEYSLTEYGYSLKPILFLMKEWGTVHHERKNALVG